MTPLPWPLHCILNSFSVPPTWRTAGNDGRQRGSQTNIQNHKYFPHQPTLFVFRDATDSQFVLFPLHKISVEKETIMRRGWKTVARPTQTPSRNKNVNKCRWPSEGSLWPASSWLIPSKTDPRQSPTETSRSLKEENNKNCKESKFMSQRRDQQPLCCCRVVYCCSEQHGPRCAKSVPFHLLCLNFFLMLYMWNCMYFL